MKIAFYTENIDVRGTCVAIYDYAHFNETLLGNKSVILSSCDGKHDKDAIIKFSKRFRLIFLKSWKYVQDIVHKINADWFYIIKYGKITPEQPLPSGVKTLVHCVFDMSEPHGDLYVGVSNSLASKFGKTEYIPHMISIKPCLDKNYNLRKLFNIPGDAIVFGRHGGMDTFNIQFCHSAIFRALKDKSNLWFILVNTPKYINHERILYLDSIANCDAKTMFINSCDAHIECGSLGHSFGISIGEFSVNNKPIILYKGPVWNTAHYDILKDKGIYFRNEEEFYSILVNFNPSLYEGKDNNCYKDYTPEKVMSIFNKYISSTS